MNENRQTENKTFGQTLGKQRYFLSAVVGAIHGWCAGHILWLYVYGIGTRAISDELYYQLRSGVRWTAAFVSLILAAASFAVVHRVQFGKMLTQHIVALFMGGALAEVGWRQGLVGYYSGLLAAFLLSVGYAYAVRRR